MTIQSVKIRYKGSVYNPDGSIASYNDGSGLMDDYKEFENGVLQYPFSGGVALGGGYYLTASHSFDYRKQGADGREKNFIAKTVFIDGASSNTWNHVRGWNSKNLYDASKNEETFGLVDRKDLTYFKAGSGEGGLSLSNFAVFNGSNAINTALMGTDIHRYGPVTSGKFQYSSSSVEGQFFTNGDNSQSGDSGGPGVAKIGNKDYVVGIYSGVFNNTKALGGQRVDAVYSYLTPKEYYNIISLATKEINKNDIIKTPDLIYDDGGRPKQEFRGSKKNANFLINGDESIILLGENSDSVNTGKGTNNIVFFQDEIGGADAGSTVIISPGTDIIVGASSNDRLVILSERLWKQEAGAPQLSSMSETSGTIQIVGGIMSKMMNGSAIGVFKPHPYQDGFYENNGYYFISYSKKDVGGRFDLTITIYAADGASEMASGPHLSSGYSKNLWTSTVVIKDFKDGDFGLRFIEGLYDHPLDTLWNQFQQMVSPQSWSVRTSENVNNDIRDEWNGLKTTPDWPIYNPSDSYINQQLALIREIYEDDVSPNLTGPSIPALVPQTVADTGVANDLESKLFDLLANDASSIADSSLTITSIAARSVSGVQGLSVSTVQSAFAIEAGKLRFTPGSLFEVLEDGESAEVVLDYVVRNAAGGEATGTFRLMVNGSDAIAINGTSENDTLIGTDRNDHIIGAAGQDTLYGGLGNDYLDGSDASGNQADYDGRFFDYTVTGNADGTVTVSNGYYGIDTLANIQQIRFYADNRTYTTADLLSRQNENRIAGTATDDVLNGTDGHDYIVGNGGKDTLYGGRGNDKLDGSDKSGNQADYDGRLLDYIVTGNADGTITVDNGYFGTDTLANVQYIRFHADNQIYSTADLLSRQGGSRIIGTAGDDTLIGTDANDYIAGGAGQDVLYGGLGNDYLDGSDASGNRAEYDGRLIDYAVTGNPDGTITVSNGYFGTDTLANIRYIRFYADDQTYSTADLLSRQGGSRIIGTSGNDTLNGTDTDDYISGGAGQDVLYGGLGNDYLDGSDSSGNRVDYDGRRSDYAITKNADGTLIVSNGYFGTDTLANIQQIRFHADNRTYDIVEV